MIYKTSSDCLTPNDLIEEHMRRQAQIVQRSFQDYPFFIKTFFPQYEELLLSIPHKGFFMDENDPELQEGHSNPRLPSGYRNKMTTKKRILIISSIMYAQKPFTWEIGYNPGGQALATKALQLIWNDLNTPRVISVFGQLAPQGIKTRKGEKFFITNMGGKVITAPYDFS